MSDTNDPFHFDCTGMWRTVSLVFFIFIIILALGGSSDRSDLRAFRKEAVERHYAVYTNDADGNSHFTWITNPDIDSYSAFFDNEYSRGTELEKLLRSKMILRLDIVGLATDYCVKFTAIDARKLGYMTTVLLFACRGVSEDTTQNAIKEMIKYGVRIV